MCLAGGVNSGLSSFWLATPFAVFLIYQYRKNYTKLGCVFLFIFFCIIVNKTQDQNPILYPNLGKEFWIDIKCKEKIVEDKNQNYDVYVDLNEICFFKKGILEVPSGVYKIIGIHHNYSAFGDSTYPIINYDGKSIVIGTAENQNADWSKNLSRLLLWPLIPFLSNEFY